MNAEVVAALTVENVGYRAFDAARAFTAATPGSGDRPPPEFAAAFERWITDPAGILPAQRLASRDQAIIIERVRSALSR